MTPLSWANLTREAPDPPGVTGEAPDKPSFPHSVCPQSMTVRGARGPISQLSLPPGPRSSPSPSPLSDGLELARGSAIPTEASRTPAQTGPRLHPRLKGGVSSTPRRPQKQIL